MKATIILVHCWNWNSFHGFDQRIGEGSIYNSSASSNHLDYIDIIILLRLQVRAHVYINPGAGSGLQSGCNSGTV